MLLEGVMCCCITRETRAAGSQTKVRTRQSPRRTSVSSASSGLGDPPPHIFVILLFSAPSFCAVLTWLYVLNAGECIVGGADLSDLRHSWRVLDQWGWPRRPPCPGMVLQDSGSPGHSSTSSILGARAEGTDHSPHPSGVTSCSLSRACGPGGPCG